MKFKINIPLHIVFIFIILMNLGCKSVPSNPPTPPPPTPVPKDTIAYTEGVLKVSAEGKFTRNNKPYYGIGINYFDAFYRYFRNNSNTYETGLETLKKNNIPFIRFTLFGYWPTDMNKYLSNKEDFYSKFDKFIAYAEKCQIGLIPSFFWNCAAIPDLLGEHTNQWENPDSKSIALMKQCTDEIISRYKDKKIIWAWEFSNEINIYLDPMRSPYNDVNHRWLYNRPINVQEGTPAARTYVDSLSTDGLRLALKEFSQIIRKYDPERAILTGNGMSHQGAYRTYIYKRRMTGDTPAEYTKALNLQNPDYINTITIHPYPPHENANYFQISNNTFDDIIRETMRSSVELKRPLFIGEFGANAALGTYEAVKFNQYLTSILNNNVQLAALWVFDYSPQDGEWNITTTNPRKYQLDAINKANLNLYKK